MNEQSQNLRVWKIAAAIILLLVSALTTLAQTSGDAQPLAPGQTIEREMKSDETQRYKFDLKANEFFQVRVEQKGVDVGLRLLDTSGAELASMNSPNGIYGFETLTWAAAGPDSFILEITNLGQQVGAVGYVIKREASRAAVEKDKQRTRAERIFAEATKDRDGERREDALLKFRQSLKNWQELGDEYLTGIAARLVKELEEGVAIATQFEVQRLMEQGTAESYRLALDKIQEELRQAREFDVKSEWVAAAMVTRGLISYNLGDKTAALKFYAEALLFSQANKYAKPEAQALSNIGQVYASLGNNQKALEYYDQALLREKQASDKSTEAFTLAGLGVLYSQMGDTQKALGYFEQALPLFSEGDDKSGEIVVVSNIGALYSVLGDKQKAQEYFERSLLLQRESRDKSGEASTLNALGKMYTELGEYKKALGYFEQALPIRKEIGDKEGEATLLSNLGIVNGNLGDNLSALRYYRQALPLFRQLGDKSGEAVTFNNIATGALLLGENKMALDFLNRALLLDREIGDKANESFVLNNIAKAYLNSGDNQKGLDYLNQALPLFRQVGDKRGEALALSNLMAAWNKLNNRNLAAFYGKLSINTFQQQRANIKGFEKSTRAAYLKMVETYYRYLADILIADGRLPEAQAVLELLKEQEFSELVRRGGGGAENVPYSKTEDAALKILDQVAALGREKSELSAKNEKGTLTAAERSRFRSLDEQISIAEAEFDKSLKSLSAETGKGQSFETVVNDAQAFMEDLRQMGSGTVALYTVIVNGDQAGEQKNEQADAQKSEPIKTGWIILVTPEFRKAYPIDVTDLEKTVSAFRAALATPEYDPQPLARALYKKLFLQTSDKQKTTLAADLDEYFKGKREKTLMWSLDGVLRYIPVSALHDGNSYLVEKYRNTVFNTASKARLKDAPRKNWSALGLGVSREREESGKTFPALSGARRELETVIKLKLNNGLPVAKAGSQGILPGRIELDDEFTREAMYDALLFDKNPVVHIASHFSYNPADFDQSFLLLGKGSLTVKDLSSKSTLFSNVDLLALSACETGLGGANGKETEGFAYVAQSLGAKSVVATLWQVDDAGTQILMPEFYRLHETGLSKAEALRQAQIAFLQGGKQNVPAGVRKTSSPEAQAGEDALKLTRFTKDPGKPYAHPYFWAPFVLIGNWK